MPLENPQSSTTGGITYREALREAPPQVALVGFGRVSERVWAQDGKPVVGPEVTASLSADHRASDGHRGAMFLAEIARLLQKLEKL